MNVWHLSANPAVESTNGISNRIWKTAAMQNRYGIRPTIALFESARPEAVSFAQQNGIRLLVLDKTTSLPVLIRELKSENAPDLLHVYSVFHYRNALLFSAIRLYRKTKYIAHPAGGLSPHILKRNRALKSIYAVAHERRLIQNADTVICLTGDEVGEVQAFAPKQRSCAVLHNPSLDETGLTFSWEGKVRQRTAVYLGRFDVEHKGLDLICQVAKRCPSFSFHLYGARPSSASFRDFETSLPSNVALRDPVYGSEKAEVLNNASVYIHLPRWEGFGNSIIDAAGRGVPVLLSQEAALSKELQKRQAAFVAPGERAELFADFLNQNPRTLERETALLSVNGYNFALMSCDPKRYVERLAVIYRRSTGELPPKLAVSPQLAKTST
ncbi:glycosyltransferase family 4 protein [Pelagicoccus sp. SDUM812003]|uniref:glycosyltransferase family 4 protein n=1 Tax=Pelagicoccus sp. SDUM812003 TaxID=3041267 RepID=UPI00280E6CCF|nr:glycosyltransferase family 4 protein [Pelagicoccus sp. SDUM812003]MDQ8204656.1 glycosyltransferase family 4 protein [Pelagicoccus sp. SDUM812003]